MDKSRNGSTVDSSVSELQQRVIKLEGMQYFAKLRIQHLEDSLQRLAVCVEKIADSLLQQQLGE